MIVLDTDVLIEIFDKNSEIGEQALNKIIASNEQFCTTTLNLHEFIYGAIKYAKQTAKISQIPILNYTKQDAELSAKLEVKSEIEGTLRMDSMIAAITINNNAKLYTLNTKHFKNFKELKLF